MPGRLMFVIISVLAVIFVTIINHIKNNRGLRDQIKEKWGKQPIYVIIVS